MLFGFVFHNQPLQLLFSFFNLKQKNCDLSTTDCIRDYRVIKGSEVDHVIRCALKLILFLSSLHCRFALLPGCFTQASSSSNHDSDGAKPTSNRNVSCGHLDNAWSSSTLTKSVFGIIAQYSTGWCAFGGRSFGSGNTGGRVYLVTHPRINGRLREAFGIPGSNPNTSEWWLTLVDVVPHPEETVLCPVPKIRVPPLLQSAHLIVERGKSSL